MQRLDSELTRLYLQPQAIQAGTPALAAAEGDTRAIAVPFNPVANEAEGQHWTRLCAVANAMQAELGLPAPAVSISGTGYYLWLSLESPVPAATVARFLTLLHAAYMPELSDQASTGAPPQLPPYPLEGGEQWAAFIHPELGASFASEPALDIAPPPAGQAALLEGLHSIGAQQFEHAMRELDARRAQTQDTGTQNTHAHTMHAQDMHAPGAASAHGATPPDLLLKDATLEDIVRFLHARNIEPTFRHLLPK